MDCETKKLLITKHKQIHNNQRTYRVGYCKICTRDICNQCYISCFNTQCITRVCLKCSNLWPGSAVLGSFYCFNCKSYNTLDTNYVIETNNGTENLMPTDVTFIGVISTEYDQNIQSYIELYVNMIEIRYVNVIRKNGQWYRVFSGSLYNIKSIVQWGAYRASLLQEYARELSRTLLIWYISMVESECNDICAIIMRLYVILDRKFILD